MPAPYPARAPKANGSSVRLEIMGLRGTCDHGDLVVPPSIKSLLDGSHLFGVVIVLVRVALGDTRD